MHQDQIMRLLALSECTFLPGSYPKRFVRDLMNKYLDTELTEKQNAYLCKIYYHYRKQIQASDAYKWNSEDYPKFVKPDEATTK